MIVMKLAACEPQHTHKQCFTHIYTNNNVRNTWTTTHRALDQGIKRQKLQLLLPVNEKEFDFLLTESVDYPCSLQREFETAVNLSKAVLLHVLGRSTPLKVTRIDDAGIEGEPCAVVFTEAKVCVWGGVVEVCVECVWGDRGMCM